MLRRCVQLAAIALLLSGLWLLASGARAGVPALLIGLVILIAVRFERWRDRTPPTAAPGAEWRRTGERFEDPGSGKTTEVEYNSRTGERRYHNDDTA